MLRLYNENSCHAMIVPKNNNNDEIIKDILWLENTEKERGSALKVDKKK